MLIAQVQSELSVILIHLDVFRGDVSLFKQLLWSYKLPFFKKEPEQKQATDSKFQRLSYHAINANNEDVTYLYKLVPGISERSFGFKVAQLAQLPASCIE
ncbi:hypothetical protein Droror1_Dr00016483 [Drosera rotundifolia]